MEEKELFEDYEIKNWEFTPRLFKMFGVGTLVTFLSVFAFGQFNLMQSKACDNAIVGTFCQVLDAAYVATTFAGEEGEWASRDYVKDTIEDADVTFVDVSAMEPPLKYPEGYFALANPEQYAEMQNPNGDVMGMPFPSDSGFPSSFPNSTFPSNTTTTPPPSATDMLNKPAELPKQNNDAVKGAIPDSPFSISDETASIPKSTPTRTTPTYVPPRRRPGNRTPRLPRTNRTPREDTLAAANTNTNTNSENAEPSSTPTDPLSAIGDFNAKFNKKPLQDFADEVIIKTDGAEKIDLTKPFMVEVQGVLNKEGKLDLKQTRFVDDDGDPKMVDVAKAAIEAVNNSGLLSYLRDQGVEKITFVLEQNDKELTAVIRGELPNESKAKTVSSGLRGLLAIAKVTNRDDDLKKLMDAANFGNQDKNFVMNFALPKKDAHEMINKKLQEARIKKSQDSSSVSNNAKAQAK